jgi:hypothetical protein
MVSSTTGMISVVWVEGRVAVNRRRMGLSGRVV